jgi:polysaccharide biosynthesis/export protein
MRNSARCAVSHGGRSARCASSLRGNPGARWTVSQWPVLSRVGVFLLLLLITAHRAPRTAHASEASPAYVFVPGDVLEITVQPQQGYDRTVTIQPDGKIVFPVVGEVVAAGLTVQQLTAALQQGLQAELKRPRVTVSLKEINKGLLRRVSVFGAVKSPGVFELKEQCTVTEMLATAGGPTPVADLRRVTITRADGIKRLVVDLARATRTGEVAENVALEPGDLIILPEGAPQTVLVLGEVAKPGSYDLQGEMRLMDALSMAGGPTTKADLQRVTLTRAGQQKEEVFNLQELLTKGQQASLAANVVLQPGDTVVLPESERKYYVLGEVSKADAYPLKEADRLLDAITAAGGSTHEADLGKVMLIRRDEKGQPVARKIDVKRMMSKGEMGLNEALQQGDVLFIPSKNPKRSVTDFLGLIYPLSGLLNILR